MLSAGADDVWVLILEAAFALQRGPGVGDDARKRTGRELLVCSVDSNGDGDWADIFMGLVEGHAYSIKEVSCQSTSPNISASCVLH